MNNKKTIVILTYFLSVVIFVGLLGFLGKPAFEDWRQQANSKSSNELSTYKERYESAQNKKLKQDEQLKQIKPIYESTVKIEDVGGLGVFGSMFDSLVKYTQADKLYIRSIEYNMNPIYDNLTKNFPKQYSSCEIKFFVVTTYSDLLRFLRDIDQNFEYLASISNLSISAFSGNTDYILANISIVLYAKNAETKK